MPVSSPSPKNESRLSAPIDLLRVRECFADPERVRESEFLRREVAMRMHERLALVKLAPRHVLDAGCGEGADLVSLQKRFADAQMLEVLAVGQEVENEDLHRGQCNAFVPAGEPCLRDPDKSNFTSSLLQAKLFS